jgi:signal transduction histidine kinase
MTPATREALDQLARELHDRAGQDLTAAILDLEFFAAKSFRRRPEPTAGRIAQNPGTGP